MEIVANTRRCKTCKETKSESEFDRFVDKRVKEPKEKIRLHCRDCFRGKRRKAQLRWNRKNRHKRAEIDRRSRRKHASRVAARKKKWRQENPEKVRAEKRRHHEKHKDKIQERLKVWREANPDYDRERSLWKNYGLTIEGYNAIFKSQGGRCAICLQKEVSGKRSKRLAVDHCHETGRIRGLLCQRCNRALGLLKDDKNVLANAITYLSEE
jgi:hypothetical protein